ncbi:CRISPR-associated protein Csx19 [Veillonella sp. VA139]|uniref:type III-D CRISPR-associated protein Csx19 n=1 Tax=Veillonella sp. VA139 TaxID=741830 RepID=UPI0013DED2C3|nr:CRISPR-associated protein Csx19 [Veillonella sp. VA139]
MSYEMNVKELTSKERTVTIERGLTFAESSTLADFANTITAPATIVVWSMNQVLWGTWDGTKIAFPESVEVNMEFATEVRVFSEIEELHVYKTKRGSWLGRKITDSEDITGIVMDTVDSTARLLGNEVRHIDGNFIECKDSGRKISQIIPTPAISGDTYGLVTRNYVDYVAETGQATYSDYRFVAIVGMKKG